MSSLLLPRRFYNQPQGAVTLDPTHWLYKDLLFIHNGETAFVNGVPTLPNVDTMARGTPIVWANSPTAPFGFGPVADSAGFATYTVPITNLPVTLSAWFGGAAGTTTDTPLALKNTSAITGVYLARGSTESYGAIATAANNPSALTSATGKVDKNFHAVGVFVSSSSRSLYLDGAAVGGSTTVRTVTTLGEVRLLQSIAGTACNSIISSFMLPMIIKRALDADEVKRLYDEQVANPWQIFRVSE